MLRVRLSVVALLALTSACGGGGGDGKQPIDITPPPTQTVATIDVTPPSSTLTLPASVQLTAVAKDAAGAVMSRTFTWSSSATTIATVSSSGLVTAVAAGNAVISAATDGKTGAAAITVIASQDGPIVARADIGPAGGTLGNADIGVTIPSGALTSASTLQIVRDTVHPPPFIEANATGSYLLDGLPGDRVVSVRVRIKQTRPVSGGLGIAVIRPTMEFTGVGDSVVLGTTIVPAIDSAGYLVGTVKLRGRPANWGSVQLPSSGLRYGRLMGGPAPADVDPQDLKAAAELSGLMGLTRTTSSSGQFDLWGIGTIADLPTKLARAGTLLEQAKGQIEAMGYSLGHRTDWPMPVYLARGKTWYGAYYSVLPYPTDMNLGYVWFNPDVINQPWFPSVVIHEFFHFTQGNFLAGKDWPGVWPARWFGEATSTWIQDKHPATALPYNDPIALSWRDSLWTGLSGNMLGSSGYGKAPIVKWMTNSYGDAKVKQIYTDVQNGVNPISAFLMALPGAADTWWPEFLKTQLGGTIYPSWPADALYPAPDGVLNVQAGRRAFQTTSLLALGQFAFFLERDTSHFGPNVSVPIFFDTAGMPFGTISAFRKAPNSRAFTMLGAGDTVKIPGASLRGTDSILVLVSNTSPQVPYTGTRRFGVRWDLTPPEGDYYFPTISGLNDATQFACNREGSTVSFNVADNATQIWSLFSTFGTWKKTQESPNPPYATFTWRVAPDLADTLRALGMTMQSVMTVGRADSLRFTGRFTWDVGSAALRSGGASGTTSHRPSTAPWWSLLLAAAVTPFLLRKGRARKAGPFVMAAVLLLLVGCVGLISMNIDESFDYTFTNPRFLIDPAKPNDPLIELTGGSGKTTMTKYRVESWTYFNDAAGKPDSARVTCTGTGSATYTVSGAEYKDGVAPPEPVPLTVEQRARALSRALGRSIKGSEVPPALLRLR